MAAPPGGRRFDWILRAVITAFALGWIFAIASATPEQSAALRSRISVNPLSPSSPPPNAYLLDAALQRIAAKSDYAGISGEVRVVVRAPGDTLQQPDSLPPDVSVGYSPAGPDSAAPGSVQTAPETPGVWNMLLRMRDGIRVVPEMKVITLVPLSEKRKGRIGTYLIGSWPNETGKPKSPQYAPPRGLVRVTPQNQDIMVSEHFRLRDFLTKGQANVWPKYVAMSPRLLDKLELTIQELERSGQPVEHIGIISGFRTPSYNEGGGNTAGRGALSRHMYGDAMDWYIDNDRDGRMDDLNGDGRHDKKDSGVIGAAAERVERAHPELVGGIGLYSPTGGHGGFIHIDTRGFRARW